jgi:hypothetical protein
MSCDPNVRLALETAATTRCLSLFESYGVHVAPLRSAPPSQSPLLYCGIIGFTGKGIMGSLAVAGSRELLVASNPVPGGGSWDWAAELSNQLMGHVKITLLAHDVELYLSTPTVVRGEHLSLQARGEARPELFTMDGQGLLALWLDVETTREFRMSAEEHAPEGRLDPGELLLF